ncbi:hypothetical protein, partial [Flavihumibacter sp. CACIAM 22H1]|uniref:hypothetical protein n=1 Tax=Flavihumibacter sp. CACIAM 22H1 TaxID=1812911 RepID=UPI0025C1E550
LAGSAVAQDTKPVKTASKGFYSMKKKAATLPANQHPIATTAINPAAPKVTKGYYSIGKNNQKLPAPTTVLAIGTISPVRKGYYSIQ